ncbi:MAG: biotin/lipoate A/B protein ligase family protein [Mariniblastus sp.]|nr:biotin/lipoate A/B protein ligase family protein [Mariniblastus sp.]
MNSCRLIIDSPATGSWNMAVDQALMETADKTARSTLRLYSWQPATLSLGYFQNYDDRQGHAESLICDCIRRSTGGGAIVHHHELTYSLCVPSDNRWSKKNAELYDVIHRATINTLKQWKVQAQLFDTHHSSSRENPSAFLCFERRTPGDVILDSFKIGGSAQRRTKHALLQHGSILLSKSIHAPQLPGITDLAPCKINTKEFSQAWVASVNQGLQFEISPGELSDKEIASATAIETNRYATNHWNKKR